jgi:hypothetical protein
MNAETFSAGLAHKLFVAAEEKGYTPALMNQLAENPTLIGKLLAVQKGLAEIVMVPLLKFSDKFTVAARIVQFIPEVSYVVNTKLGPHVKVGYVDVAFTRRFGKKIEEPTAATTLRSHVLTRPSAFAPAMKEIRDGGGVATKTTPGELFSLMEQQPDGPQSVDGALLTNGYANLFEMDDIDGVACLVYAYWYSVHVGWFVYVREASYSNQWYDENRFFSRDSHLPLVA